MWRLWQMLENGDLQCRQMILYNRFYILHVQDWSTKDEKGLSENSDVVYDIPCQTCGKSDIGETLRQFGGRLERSFTVRFFLISLFLLNLSKSKEYAY